MSAIVSAQLAALKTTSTADLKALWRKLNDTEPPPYNRRFLESRLSYRVQELAYGGLKPATVKKLEALGEQIDGRRSGKRRPRMDAKPIAGTRLVREWQGRVETVTVHGRWLRVAGPALPVALRGSPRDHRHAVEWLDLLRPQEPAAGGSMSARSEPRPARKLPSHRQTARKLRCAVYTRKIQRGGSGAGFQQPRCPTRGLRGLHPQPAGGRLAAGCLIATTTAVSPAVRWSGQRFGGSSPTSRPAGLMSSWSTRSIASAAH